MPECTSPSPRYSVLSKETLDRIRKRMSFFRQFLGCGNSMQRSPVRFTLTSSCKQIQLKAWRVDWDGLPPDRSLCTGAPWETEIVLPRCDSSVWLNVCCHIRYLSSFRKRSWPIGVEHSTGFDLQFVWKNFDKWGKTAPSPHDGRKLDERPLLQNLEAAKGQWKMLMKLVQSLPVIEALQPYFSWGLNLLSDLTAMCVFCLVIVPLAFRWKMPKVWGGNMGLRWLVSYNMIQYELLKYKLYYTI